MRDDVLKDLNEQLRSTVLHGEKLNLLELLEYGADPFHEIGTTDSPIYIAAGFSPDLVPILLNPLNMKKQYQARFEKVKNTYLLTAMMGAMSNEHRPNIGLLEKLLAQYKGDPSATIPFFSDHLCSKGLIFSASQCHCAEPLEMLIQHGAKDVKVDWGNKNYGIQDFLWEGSFLRKKDFLKMLTLLLSINPERINEYCPYFDGTCLDFFCKQKNQVRLRYEQYLTETIQMLVDAGGQAKSETWEYLRERFGIVQKTPQPEKIKSLTYLHNHRKDKPLSNDMDLDVTNKELLESSFGQSIANRYRKA